MVRRFLTERHDPLLAALAPDVNRLLLVVDVREVERDQLGAPQPSRVEELQQRTISEREGRMPLCELEQALHLRLLRRVRQPPRPARGEGGVRDSLGPVCEAQARANSCNAAGDRRGGELRPAAAEVGDPVRESLGVDVAESEPALVEPAREGAQVGAVCAPARVREPAVLEEAVDRRGGAHGFDSARPRVAAARVASVTSDRQA